MLVDADHAEEGGHQAVDVTELDCRPSICLRAATQFRMLPAAEKSTRIRSCAGNHQTCRPRPCRPPSRASTSAASPRTSPAQLQATGLQRSHAPGPDASSGSGTAAPAPRAASRRLELAATARFLPGGWRDLVSHAVVQRRQFELVLQVHDAQASMRSCQPAGLPRASPEGVSGEQTRSRWSGPEKRSCTGVAAPTGRTWRPARHGIGGDGGQRLPVQHQGAGAALCCSVLQSRPGSPASTRQDWPRPAQHGPQTDWAGWPAPSDGRPSSSGMENQAGDERPKRLREVHAPRCQTGLLTGRPVQIEQGRDPGLAPAQGAALSPCKASSKPCFGAGIVAVGKADGGLFQVGIGQVVRHIRSQTARELAKPWPHRIDTAGGGKRLTQATGCTGSYRPQPGPCA